MRAYLDHCRNDGDPERLKARLGTIAGDLLKPRGGQALATWLTSQLAQAVGASAATLVVRETDTRVPGGIVCGDDAEGDAFMSWCVIGTVRSCDFLRELTALLVSFGFAGPSAVPHPIHLADGLLLPLAGVEGLVGGLWLEHCQPLDATTTALLSALADAAGAALERTIILRSFAEV